MATKKSRNPVVAMSAGAIAGGIETCVVWPMEFVKTQLQLQNKVAVPKYTGVLSCFKYTIQTTGFLSLYRGLAPVLIGSIPKAGIRFGGFAYIQDKLRLPGGEITPSRTLLAGMVAGAVESTLVVVPVETLKTRLIHGNEGMLRGAMNIIKKEGPGGVYRGWAATTVKQASNQGLRFMAFGQYKKFMLGDEKRGLNPIEALFGGMMSGLFSTVCNNPADLIKTRMQGLDGTKYKGAVDCLTTVVKEEGVLALWNGVIPRLARVVPGQGVIFMSYETISKFVEGFVEGKK